MTLDEVWQYLNISTAEALAILHDDRLDRTPSGWDHLVYTYPLPTTYAFCPNPLRFMTWARHRQGFGAARTKSERFMDVRPWEDYSWASSEEDWDQIGRRKSIIYPASLFKGRQPVDRERIVCACCGEVFTSRRASRFCSPACRQKVFRKRKSVRGA